jgi:hypothetical protein
MWVWFWRSLGILAAITMIATLVVFWTAWRASPFQPAVNGQPLPSGIDVISIQLDILSLVIAVAGIGLAVAGVVGYQAIKAAAIARADEVATAAIALHIARQDKTGTDSGTQAPVEPVDVVEITKEEKGG